MRLLLAATSVVLLFAGLSCSGDSGPGQRQDPGYDLEALAAVVCFELKSDSPARYQSLDGSAPNAPDYVVQGSLRAIDLHATIEQYSDALAAECPRTIERFLGTESYWEWMRD